MKQLKVIDSLDLMLARSTSKLPANISTEYRKLWLEKLDYSVRAIARDLVQNHQYQIFVVNQRRGWCKPYIRQLVIPVWAINDTRAGYVTYYTAHELAHCFTVGNNHGQEFMAAFMEICPEEYQIYELDYKPRNAAIAGIGQISLNDI